MSSTETSDDQDWLQFVEEVQLSSPVTSSGGGGCSKLSLATSTDHNQRLNPTGCISKPVRRRSGAPRRSPATLLTANTTNFRALVQKFTGRPTAPFSSRSHRGPLTLNFQLGTQQHIHPFRSDYRSSTHHHCRRHEEEEEEQQQQQQFFPADDTSITNDVILSTVSEGHRNPQGDHFTMENISLDHELSVNCFSDGLNTTDDIGYFW